MKKIELDLKTGILLGLFCTLLLLGNLLGSKVITIFGIITSVGIFSYPVSFLITDIVAEVKGKRTSQMFVYIGFVCLLVALGYTFLSLVFPPASIYEHNPEYSTVFSNSIRVILASLTAFFFSQIHDVWAFHFWKRKTNGKFLWLRNNLSTIVSQLIDTIIFMFIAYYMVSPKFTVSNIIIMIIPYWLLKVSIAILDTPFVYLGVRWLKK